MCFNCSKSTGPPNTDGPVCFAPLIRRDLPERTKALADSSRRLFTICSRIQFTAMVACSAMMLLAHRSVAEVQHSEPQKDRKSTLSVSNLPSAPGSVSSKKSPGIRQKKPISSTVEPQPRYDARLQVSPGNLKRIRVARRVQRLSVADTEVADVVPVSSNELAILGRSQGVTTVHLWLADDQEREATTVKLLILVPSE
jgi:hypothetical protein